MNSYFCEIRYRNGEVPGARYISGGTVYDEAFTEGRLVTRYWNPNGQVWPEMHYQGRSWPRAEPADAFRLSINGRDLSGGYAWDSASGDSGPEPGVPALRNRRDEEGHSLPATYGVIQLRHAVAGILVRVHTRLDGDPFIVRWLEVTNLNAEPVGITTVAPFAGNLWLHRTEEHLPRGAESPFELAYNHLFDWGREGDFWAEPIAVGRKTVDGEKKGRSGWGRPAFWARDLCNGQTFVCELAWGGNYVFALDLRVYGDDGSGRFFANTRDAGLFFSMGLSGHDDVLRVLAPGETITTPAVHLALFQTDADAIVQATHDHVRHVVLPEPVPGRYVEIEANHRGYLIDRENVPGILKDIDVARAVGAEMYVIDAGWFGNEPNEWGNNVGDWFEGPWMAEGGGLKAVSDYVHEQGIEVRALGRDRGRRG